MASPPERERIVTVPIEGDWATLSYRVGWRAGRALTPAATALIEQLTAGSRTAAMATRTSRPQWKERPPSVASVAPVV